MLFLNELGEVSFFCKERLIFTGKEGEKLYKRFMKTSLGDFVRSPPCYVSEPLAFKPQALALIDAERFAILPKLMKRPKLFFCDEHRLRYSKALPLSSRAAATR